MTMASPSNVTSCTLPRATDVLASNPTFKKKSPIKPKAASPSAPAHAAEILPPAPRIVPNENDVLCGKTRQCLVHHGSVQFRYLIESYTERYEKAEDKYSKMSLTREIYNRVSQTARFLRYNQKVGGWEELTAAVARDKVGHALRFSSIRRSKKPRRVASDAASVSPPLEITINPAPQDARPCLIPPAPEPQVSIGNSATIAVVPPQQPHQTPQSAAAPPAVVLSVPGTASSQQPAPTAPQQALNSLFMNYMQSFGGNGGAQTSCAPQVQPAAPQQQAGSTPSVQTIAAPAAPQPDSAVESFCNGTTADELLEFISSSPDELTLNDLLSFVKPASGSCNVADTASPCGVETIRSSPSTQTQEALPAKPIAASNGEGSAWMDCVFD